MTLAVTAAAALTLAGHLTAAPRFVLRIADHDGSTLIPGEAPAPYTDWIEAVGFGNDAALAKSADGSVLPSTALYNDFVVRKHVDQSTPLLLQALSTNKLLPAVQIKYLGRDGSAGTGAEPLSVELRHVQVTSYHLLASTSGDSGADSVPMEQFSLNYSEVEWIYRRHDQSAQVTETVDATLVAFLGTDDPNFDDDNDGLPNDRDDDDDNDGIPDSDELAGGSNPYRDDADEDLDGDGQSNRDEAIANTRMDDATDYFGIEKITHRRTAEGLEVIVSIPVSDGRRYRLLASPDPSVPKDFWMVIDEFDLPLGSPETGADIELNPALLQGGAQLFFRVEVERLAQ